MKDEADDPEKHGTRYHHFLEVMGERQEQKVLSYDDLLAILRTSWEELENMGLPELAEEDGQKREKASYTYSTDNSKGTTIGEILAARGILLKPDQAK